MGTGFYGSNDPTNSFNTLKEQYMHHVTHKNVPHYFQTCLYSDNFYNKFAILPAYLISFMQLESGNQLKFQQYSMLHTVDTVFKLFCCKIWMSSLLTAPKLWLPNIPDCNTVDHRVQNVGSMMSVGL